MPNDDWLVGVERYAIDTRMRVDREINPIKQRHVGIRTLMDLFRCIAEIKRLRRKSILTDEKVDAAAASLLCSSQIIWDAWELPRDQNWRVFAYPALLAAGMEEERS